MPKITDSDTAKSGPPQRGIKHPSSKIPVVHGASLRVGEAQVERAFAAAKPPLLERSHLEGRQLHKAGASPGLGLPELSGHRLKLATDQNAILCKLHIAPLKAQEFS